MAVIPWVWLAAAIAGFIYSAQYGVPTDIALKAFPAFLLEVTFFLFLGVEGLRRRIEKFPHGGVALLLTAAAAVPYLAASLAFGGFDWRSLAWLTGLAATAAFWYVVLPRNGVVDVLFVALAAAVALTKVWKGLYPLPHARVPMYVLGQLMWIRTCAMALLAVRRVQGVGFGFWPRALDWRVGALYYLMFLPIGAAAAYLIGFAQPHLPVSNWLRTPVIAVGTFFGILWVVALGEEFLFRGLVQQWLGGWLKSPWAGLILASLLFGAVHLWYQAFPNWKFAVMAGLAGLFYGMAFRKAQSIRSSMVAHALTVTTLRLFFS
jgi:membrane protease YdiL (CAAX protease family)